MMWLYVLLGVSGFFGTLALTRHQMMSEVFNYDAPLTTPPYTSIVMATFNEEAFIETALQSLTDQNLIHAYPDSFEIIVADSHSTDKTVEIARRYTQNVLALPQGKLTAKHLAILDANGEVIVNVDADSYYPPNWLNLILTRFEDPTIIAVGGFSMTTSELPHIKFGYTVWTLKTLLMRNCLLGRNSAFRKNAYLTAGGYFLDFNQQNVLETQYWEEEEITERLKQLGAVIFDVKATVLTSPRLFYCKPRAKILGLQPLVNSDTYDEYCREIERGERM